MQDKDGGEAEVTRCEEGEGGVRGAAVAVRTLLPVVKGRGDGVAWAEEEEEEEVVNEVK